MNKIFRFFIPFILKDIALYFTITLVGAVLLTSLPLEAGFTNFFKGVAICLFFPLGSYFSKRSYLPKSMHWILLTPSKKGHIVLAHGLLNLFKLSVIALGSYSLLFLFFRNAWQGLNEIVLHIVRSPDEIVSGTVGYTLLFLSFILFLLLIFGILPDFKEELTKKRDYQVRGLKKNKTSIMKTGFMVLGSGVAFLIIETEFIPEFIGISLVIVALVVGGVSSTLSSVKYFYRSRMNVLSFAVAFISLSSFIYWHAKVDVNDETLVFRKRIDSLEYLGRMAAESTGVIFSVLGKAGPETSSLRGEDLEFLFDEPFKQGVPALSQNLDEACLARADHSCRLLAMAERKRSKDQLRLDLLKKSCPNDLKSCYFIYVHKAASPEEKVSSWREMESKCVDKAYEDKSETCRFYKKLTDKKKKES